MANSVSLADYRLLGRSGLRVSPLCLGSMTFGEVWGADAATSRRIFDTYVDHGGNFIDTANYYAGGVSEDLLGEFAAAKRDNLVLATKYSLTQEQGDPNRGGNHRKNMMWSVEQSLKRLKTDYIDLYYLHVWDETTPPDEVLRGLDDLVRQGKVLYIGISDTPAWQVSRMQTMAELRGWSTLAALQIEYNLIERSVENDLIPMAREMGLGVIPWAPVKMGLLTGRYTRADVENAATGAGEAGRKSLMLARGALTERVLSIIDVLTEVASETGGSPAQVAVAWILTNPAVTAPILGARTVEQLTDNLGALEVRLSEDQIARLNAVSRMDPIFPHSMKALEFIMSSLYGGAKVRPRG